MSGNFVEVVAIICAVGLPVLTSLIIGRLLIKTRNAERLAMIERGMDPRESKTEKKDPNRYTALRDGLLMIGLALGAILGVILAQSLPWMEKRWLVILVPAVVIFFGGLAFVIYFFLSRYLMRKEAKENEKDLSPLE